MNGGFTGPHLCCPQKVKVSFTAPLTTFGPIAAWRNFFKPWRPRGYHEFVSELQDGAPKIAFSCLKKWLYGRYNELVKIGVLLVYKPTYNWGAPSC